MNHRCAFVGNRFVSAAFSVAGIDAYPADGAEEARERVSSILENAGLMGEPYGLVLVEGIYWDAMDAMTREAFSMEQKPVIVPVNLAAPVARPVGAGEIPADRDPASRVT